MAILGSVKGKNYPSFIFQAYLEYCLSFMTKYERENLEQKA